MDKSKCWVKMKFNVFNPTSTVHFLITLLTQHLGLSIFDPTLCSFANRDLTGLALFIHDCKW